MTTETAASGGVGLGRGGRMSRKRKRDAVLRLLRGEDLETLSRALGATAATLTGWHDTFVAAGEASLATRSTQPSAWASMPPGVVDESAWPFPLGSSCASTLLPDPKPGRRYWACFIEASAFGCGSGAVVSTADSGCRGALELGWPLPERVVPGSGLFALGS